MGLLPFGSAPSTGSSSVSIGSTVTGGTTGSVLFIGSSSTLAQNNAAFFWDNSTNNLKVGALTATGQGSGNGIFIGGDTQIYRNAIDQIMTPDSFVVGANFLVQGGTSTFTASGSPNAMIHTVTTQFGAIVQEELRSSIANSLTVFRVRPNGSGATGVMTSFEFLLNDDLTNFGRLLLVGQNNSTGVVWASEKGGTGTNRALRFRSGANSWDLLADLLVLDNNVVTFPNATSNSLAIGIGGDTNLYRTSADVLATDDTFSIGTRLRLSSVAASSTANEVWVDSTQKTVSSFVNGIHQKLSGTIFTATADATVTNTVTETSVVGTGVGTMTLPANFFVAGKSIRLRIGGVYSTPALTTPSVVIKVKYGSTVIASVTTTTLFAGASNLEFDGEVFITCRTTGSSGTVMAHGDVEYATGVGGTISVDPLNNAGSTTTINTTTSNALDVTVTWDSATTTRIVKATVCEVEVIN